MDSESTREDVEERLRDTAEAMSDRLSALEEEVSSTGTSLREWVVQNPWKSVGGMLVAGLAVGALFGGRGSQRRPEHAELLDRYVDALRAEVEEAVAAGEAPGEALERALRGRAPLVVYTGENGGNGDSRGGFLGQSVGFLFRTVAREVARDALLSMLGDGADEEVVDEEIFE